MAERDDGSHYSHGGLSRKRMITTPSHAGDDGHSECMGRSDLHGHRGPAVLEHKPGLAEPCAGLFHVLLCGLDLPCGIVTR